MNTNPESPLPAPIILNKPSAFGSPNPRIRIQTTSHLIRVHSCELVVSHTLP